MGKLVCPVLEAAREQNRKVKLRLEI